MSSTVTDVPVDVDAPRPRPRRLGLWIALGVIGAVTLASLTAMLVASRVTTAAAREHHEALVQSVMGAQNFAMTTQLTGSGPAIATGVVGAAGSLGGLGGDGPQVSTEVLEFTAGLAVTRSTIESDGLTTVILSRGTADGSTQSWSACVLRSSVMAESCAANPEFSAYLR